MLKPIGKHPGQNLKKKKIFRGIPAEVPEKDVFDLSIAKK